MIYLMRLHPPNDTSSRRLLGIQLFWPIFFLLATFCLQKPTSERGGLQLTTELGDRIVCQFFVLLSSLLFPARLLFAEQFFVQRLNNFVLISNLHLQIYGLHIPT